MDTTDDKLRKEQELEEQMAALQQELATVRAENRTVVVADVKAKIKRYGITRSELASAFTVRRRSSKSTEPKLNADGSVRKKRGRRTKQQIAEANEGNVIE